MTEPPGRDARVPGDRRAVAQAALLLVLLPPWIRRRGIGRTTRHLDRLARRLPGGRAAVEAPLAPPQAHSRAHRLAEARRLAALVERANRRYAIPRADCLPLSLALRWLLARRGIASDLRVGVRTITGRFESHAWLECDGVVLNDTADVGRLYECLDRAAPGAAAR